jgi:hypothetical protein
LQAVVLHVARSHLKYLCAVLDHQFYHKWAVLLDQNWKGSFARGFLKFDVTVIGRGETVKIHEYDELMDEEDIEG